MPGEFLEYDHDDTLHDYEGEVAIEPHVDSPSDWPVPTVSRVISGRVRIPNTSNDPVKVSRSQNFAVIRRVISPNS